MKKLIVLLWFIVLNLNVLHAVRLEEIQYEVLKKSEYTDHVEIFNHLFNELPLQNMIEFGLGLGTKFFLDRIPQVTSVEIVNQDQSDTWYQDCCELYKSYSNWNPVLFRGSLYLTQANIRAMQAKDPSLYDKNYLLEIHELVFTFTEKKYDLAFVDPGIHNRSDIIDSLFNRVDIISAHDTNFVPEIYGWNRIITPPNYRKISFTMGMGVTFWVKQEREDVINALLKIKQSLH